MCRPSRFPARSRQRKRALLTSVDRSPQDARPTHAPPGLPPAGLPPSDAAAAPAAGQLEGSARAARARRTIQNRGASPSISALSASALVVIGRSSVSHRAGASARAAGTVANAGAEAARVSRTTRSIDGPNNARVRASLGAHGHTAATRTRDRAREIPTVVTQRGIFSRDVDFRGWLFSERFRAESDFAPRAISRRERFRAVRVARETTTRKLTTPFPYARLPYAFTFSSRSRRRTSRRRKETNSRITF